ncbi:hypothetical protein ABBQ38_012053 [Trebouxia sp. C0009 RCD-2024]
MADSSRGSGPDFLTSSFSGASSSGSDSDTYTHSDTSFVLESQQAAPADPWLGQEQTRQQQTRHTYLGDVDDLEGGGTLLDAGQICHLPLIPLEGIVLMPGDTLPLKVVRRQDRQKLESALTAPAPFTRLIAVACMSRSDPGAMHLHTVGCTAEIRQVHRQEGGALSIVAKGLQRLQLNLDLLQHNQSLSHTQQTITADAPVSHIPSEAKQGVAFWPAHIWARYNAFQLAKEAMNHFIMMAPRVRQLHMEPVAVSYWLASNLPLEDDTRQRLLEAPTVVERLKNELALMQRMASLRCRFCMTQVAFASDVVSMSSEGTGGAFVNSHGYVHDMITLHRATNAVCDGEPETEHSWFPGFAWTIAYCAGCTSHLGWKFTAAQRNQHPQSFWGLRRPAITELNESRRNMMLSRQLQPG